MYIICVATYLYLRIVTFHITRKIRRENNTYRRLLEDPASIPPNCHVSYEQETRRENNIQRWLSEDPARICLPSVKLLFHDQDNTDVLNHTLFTTVIWVVGVEGLYCKRPTQCLASSEILTPQPSPPGECVPLPPAFGAGGVLCGVWGRNGIVYVRNKEQVLEVYFVYLHLSVLHVSPILFDVQHVAETASINSDEWRSCIERMPFRPCLHNNELLIK